MNILKTYRALFVLLVFLVGTNAPLPAHPSQNSAATSAESTAHILLTTLDSSGNPVLAPPKDTVQLKIARQLVEIEEIRSLSNSPLFFSILVDLSGSSREFADKQVSATTRLFSNLSTGDNHGYLILFRDELATDDQFIRPAAVENILKRFPAQSRSGGTALYDAILHAATVQLTSTKTPRDSRRAIFVLSDGGENSSHTTLNETLKVLQAEQIPVYSIGFSHSKDSDSPRELEWELGILKALSEATGGWGTFLDEPGDFIGRAVSLINAQCLASFKLPTLKPGKSYPLKIESSMRDVHLLAAKAYIVR